MATSDEVNQFVMAVGVHFPPLAQGDDAKVWVASMERVLSRMEPKVLAKAAEIIIATRNPKRDGKWFPTPSECIAACDQARADLALENRAPLLSHGNRDQSPWASWRQDTADMLIKTEMGKRAVKDGCILTLWNFCRENGRLPSEDVYAQMIRGADKTLELIERIANETDGVAQACARFGQTVLERRKQMAEFVEGKGDAIWRN